MLVVIVYDVNTEDAAGRRRLRHVARKCVDFGQRVQNSVFECSLDAAQFVSLKSDLLKIIDTGRDSLRFYNIGNKYHGKVEHFGAKPSYMPDDDIII